MARVGFINVPVEMKDAHRKLVTPVTKTVNSSVRWNGRIVPPRRRSNYHEKSQLFALRALWQALSDEQREAWRAAGLAQGYNAWNTFVQDTAYRLKYSMPGVATPSVLHSYLVGQVQLQGDATSLHLQQQHPINHYRLKRVKGTKSQAEPVKITEVLQLPLQIGLSWRSNLTAVGPNPTVRFYGTVTYSTRGSDATQEIAIALPLVSSWDSFSAQLDAVAGAERFYALHFEFTDCQGTAEFDLIQSKHNGTNFARDFRCHSIADGFKNANYEVPAPWEAIAAPTGATFGSVYPSDEDL